MGGRPTRGHQETHTPPRPPPAPPPVGEGGKPYSDTAQCLRDPIVGAGRDIPSKAQKIASSLYRRLLRKKEAQGPVGLFAFWKQHISHPDTLFGLTQRAMGQTLSLEAGPELKRALKPWEGSGGWGAALRFGPQDPADPIVLTTVGGSLKERDAVWSLWQARAVEDHNGGPSLRVLEPGRRATAGRDFPF